MPVRRRDPGRDRGALRHRHPPSLPVLPGAEVSTRLLPPRALLAAVAFLPLAALLAARPARATDGNHIDLDRLTAEIEASPAPRPELLLLRSRLLRAHGKPSEALADCDRARELAASAAARPAGATPALPPLAPWEEPLERALALVDLSRDAEASVLLARVIEGERVPASAAASALDASSRLRSRSGAIEEALADATEAYRREPTIDRALRRGGLLASRGALDEAAKLYREARDSLGDSLLLTDAWIGVEIARGEFESALGLIDAELARAAVRTSWLVRRAEVFEAAGNGARRLEALREALAEADRTIERRRLPIHLVARGRIRLSLGDPAGARLDAEAAGRLAPGFPGVAELLAEIAAPGPTATDPGSPPGP